MVLQIKEGGTSQVTAEGARIALGLSDQNIIDIVSQGGDEGPYLPLSGGTIDGNLIVTDNITAGAFTGNINANDLTSGTIPNGRFPPRLQETPAAITNCDTVTETGWYRPGASSTGSPDTATGLLMHINYSAAQARQFWYRHSNLDSYTRYKSGSVWSAWEAQLVQTSGVWVPTLSFGGATTGITYTNRVGTWHRVGNVMFVVVDFLLSSKGSATGISSIGGLPVTVNGNTTGSLGTATGMVGLTSTPTLTSSNNAVIPRHFSATGSATLNDAHFSNTSRILGSIAYTV